MSRELAAFLFVALCAAQFVLRALQFLERFVGSGRCACPDCP